MDALQSHNLCRWPCNRVYPTPALFIAKRSDIKFSCIAVTCPPTHWIVILVRQLAPGFGRGISCLVSWAIGVLQGLDLALVLSRAEVIYF